MPTRVAGFLLALTLLLAMAPLGAAAGSPSEIWIAFQGLHVKTVAPGCREEVRREGSSVVSCGKNVSTTPGYTYASPSSGADDGTCIVEVRLKKAPATGFAVSVLWGGKIRCTATWTNDSTVDVRYTRT